MEHPSIDGEAVRAEGARDGAAPAPEQTLLQMAVGKWACQALKVAAALGVADLLAGGAKSVHELARRTGAHEDALYRLLRALASLGVFKETPQRRFENNALSQPLRSDVAGSVGAMIRWIGEESAWRAWNEFEYSVRTGKPAFERVFGEQVFEYFAHHPGPAAIFNAAMNSFSAGTGAAVARAYDFSPFRRVVDVGGGHGALLAAIAERFPDLRGVLFDRPEVIASARQALASSGHAKRIELCAGDFLDEVPEGGDAYIMKHIIHDWDDERCIRILTLCRKAMAAGGTVLVVEQVIQDGPESAFAKLLDLEMLAMTPGGRERSAAEFSRLFERAGLRLTRIVPTGSFVTVIEAVPAAEPLH